MGSVFGDNATGRTGRVLALYLLVLACMGGAYMGGQLLRPVQQASADANRFWARGIPSAELVNLSSPARANALESLTRELTGLGQTMAPTEELLKAAKLCLGGDQADTGACRRLEDLAKARMVQSRAKRDFQLKAGLSMWGGFGLAALICGVPLFCLLGRAGRAALGLALLGFLFLAAMEVSALMDGTDAQDRRATLERLEMKIRLNLQATGDKGRRRLAIMAQAVPRLPLGKGKEGRALTLALLRCRNDALSCPRVLTPLTRYQQAALVRLEPPPSRARLRGWLQISALMVLLLVPLLGALDRR